MSRTLRTASWVLAAAIAVNAVGCVQQGMREVKQELIESDSEGRNTVIDIKLEKYQRLAREFPKEPCYRERLARLYWMKNDHKQALSNLQKAKSLDPKNPKYSYFEGTIYSGIGNYRLAEASFKDLLENSDGKFTGPYIQLAEICLLQEREPEALQYLEECTKIDPAFATPHYYIGRIHLAHRDQAQAIEHFELYLRLGGGMYQDEVLQLLDGMMSKLRFHTIKD